MGGKDPPAEAEINPARLQMKLSAVSVPSFLGVVRGDT